MTFPEGKWPLRPGRRAAGRPPTRAQHVPMLVGAAVMVVAGMTLGLWDAGALRGLGVGLALLGISAGLTVLSRRLGPSRLIIDPVTFSAALLVLVALSVAAASLAPILTDETGLFVLMLLAICVLFAAGNVIATMIRPPRR